MPYQGQSNGNGQPTRRHERVVQFGCFEFRPDTHELHKNGIRIRVQAKPLQILRALIDRPGELVTREALCRELWPDGTFVDFESGLNTATNRLRAALNDSADSPRYIETLPRLGYRFICPVIENLPRNEAPVVAPINVASINKEVVQAASATDEQPKHPVSNPAKPARAFWSKPSYGVSIAVVCALLSGLAAYTRNRSLRTAEPVFHPLTYTSEFIESARFSPEANKAVYSTYSQREGARTLSLKLDGGTTAPVMLQSGALASISQRGDLALLISCLNPHGPKLTVTKAQQKPYIVAENAKAADWLPQARGMALVRTVGLEAIVEFPAGHAAYRSTGWITELRVSPDGMHAAFIEHASRDDDRGHIRILDPAGHTRELTRNWASASGLAWSPSGGEIWFTASEAGAARSLYAVSTRGNLRRVSNGPGSLRLLDIGGDGRMLLSVEDRHDSMLAKLPGADAEIDLTQFDNSHVEAMSSDGQLLLFTEGGDAGGQHYSTFVFDNMHHTTRFIGSGRGIALSPDSRLVVMVDPRDDSSLGLVSLEGGVRTRISGHGLHYQWARFLSDRSLLVGGSYEKEPLKLYRQGIEGTAPVVVNGIPYVDYPVIAPDGNTLVGISARESLMISLCDKSVRSIPFQELAFPAGWSIDGKSVLFAALSHSGPALLTLDAATNSVSTWKELHVPNSSSFSGLAAVVAAPSAGAYAYSTHRNISHLYLVEGWL